MRATSALDLIGNTPLISLDRIHAGGPAGRQAEFLQPGGSVKDRAAKAILLAARADGRLKPGMPVVEMTSGNMGAGLAVACAALGHPLLVTMSAGNSPARARMLEGLGAEVILVPQVDGAPGQVTGADVQAAADMAAALARERGGFYVDQFNAVECIAAHEAGPRDPGTAGPTRRRLGRGGGTGCTFMGVARSRRQRGNRVRRRRAAGRSAGRPAGLEGAAPDPGHQLRRGAAGRVADGPEPGRDGRGSQGVASVGYSAAANVCAA